MNNDIIKENKIAWEEASLYHQKGYTHDLGRYFQTKNAHLLNDFELKYFNNMNINNKVIAHLCCNNGKEVFSLSNLGAREVWGFDFNKVVINEANETKKAINCRNVFFIETDIYSIDEKENSKYDIILINVGTIGWFPELENLFLKVYNMLKKNGKLYICDIHPFCDILNDDRNSKKSPLEVTGKYLEKTPFWNKKGFDYIGQKKYNAKKCNWYTYTISELINSVIKAGLIVDKFEESENDISGVYPILENLKMKLPLSFELICRK